MSFKKLVLLSFLFLILNIGFTQQPGFMGKRLSLNLDLSVYPALIRPVTNNQPYVGIKWYGINYRLTSSIDVILSKKSTIGLDFNYYHSATNIDTSLQGGAPQVIKEFEGYTLGMHYRVFMGNTKAPIGFYYKVETGATFYSMNNTTTLGNFYINNSIGRQHIFYNRLILNYGLSLGFVMPTIYDYYNPPSNEFSNRLSYSANLRSLSHFGLNIYGGVGILLF